VAATQVTVLLLLVGCYPEATFREDQDAAVCAWKAACYAESEPDCLAAAEAARTDVDPSCAYHANQARDCVDGLEALGCRGDADTGSFGFPSACDRVWDCR
jgi:hypothetical protein